MPGSTGDTSARRNQEAGAIMRVVICGGGVIGASIACFLSRRGVKPLVVERTGIACAASGKAGGFLARHWCDGAPLQQLARRSFDLHAELAEQSREDWGYRRLTTYGGLSTERAVIRGHAQSPIAWVSPRVEIGHQLGSPEDTAQVHPALFTAAMMRTAQRNGAELRLGLVTGIQHAAGRITGVAVDSEIIEADAVIIAMGPWSILAAAWLPLPAVYGLKGHSLVFDTGAAVPPEALFLEFQEGSGELQSPEFFPRPDGTIYVCAISSDSPLPVDPAAVGPDPGAIERLERICAAASPALASVKIVARQACFRPIAADGLPLIGRVPGVEGGYVATGHSVWGILNAPATGEAMAELILDGATRTVDLAPFDPGRLRPLDPARLQSLRAP
jgi:glycine/D-amino acid oxidase-like deaminating enzyme